MQRLEVICAVRRIYIYVVRRQRVNVICIKPSGKYTYHVL